MDCGEVGGDDKMNRWGIPDWLEKKVRDRDKFCVYCHIPMKEYPRIKGTPCDKATIEHMDDEAVAHPTEKNIAICCGSCNSSRGARKLLDWFELPHCKNRSKPINEETVDEIVREFLRKAGKK